MRLYLVVATGILVSGCTVTSYSRPAGFLPLIYGSVDEFAALVPPSSSGTPRCEEPTRAPLGTRPGQRAIALAYPGPIEQRITVLLDSSGVPTFYLDVRGDLSTPEASVGDRTTIGLYLDEDYAVLSNRPEDGEHVIVEVPLAEALTSDRLGNPAAMLDRVLDTCGRDI